jgi:hypothetical protein
MPLSIFPVAGYRVDAGSTIIELDPSRVLLSFPACRIDDAVDKIDFQVTF